MVDALYSPAQAVGSDAGGLSSMVRSLSIALLDKQRNEIWEIDILILCKVHAVIVQFNNTYPFRLSFLDPSYATD